MGRLRCASSGWWNEDRIDYRAYLAARLGVQKLIEKEAIDENPFNDSVAAISVGIYEDEPVLDLPHIEDRDASVDFNVVMAGSGQYVEVREQERRRLFLKSSWALS